MKTSHKLAATGLMLSLLLALAVYLAGHQWLTAGHEQVQVSVAPVLAESDTSRQEASSKPREEAATSPDASSPPATAGSSPAISSSSPATSGSPAATDGSPPTSSSSITSETSGPSAPETRSSPATETSSPSSPEASIPSSLDASSSPEPSRPSPTSETHDTTSAPTSDKADASQPAPAASPSPVIPESGTTQAQTEESTLATAGLQDPAAPSERELDAWQRFRHAYNKSYVHEEEARHRQAVFLTNLRLINSFNEQRQAQFSLAVNKFADLTRDEINHLFVGPQVGWPQTLAQMQAPEPKSIRVLGPESEPKPAALDMRNLLGVPLDQGRCLDSSVFAAVAALEAARQLASGGASPPLKLSERHLLDCLAGQPGAHPPPCQGFNSMLAVLEQLSRAPLLAEPVYAELLAQRAGQPFCQLPEGAGLPAGTSVRLSHYTTLHRDNIPDALANGGPLVVALDASQSSFHFYAGGLYHELGCSADAYSSHALLVGLDEASYLARMSFGPHWGESGHIRLLRDEQRNKCQPQHVAILPHVAPEL